MARIVVGIDGSEHAIAALRWAIGEARLRGATIDAIDAWNYPYVAVPGANVPLHPRGDQAIDVELELEQAIAAVADEADGVTISLHRHRGRARRGPVRGRRRGRPPGHRQHGSRLAARAGARLGRP